MIEEVATKEMGWRVSKNENNFSEFDLYWQDLGIESERLQTLKPYQKVNHFPAMFQITRKACLARNLKRLAKLFPADFDFIPRTWVLPTEMFDLKVHALERPPRRNKSKLKGRLASLLRDPDKEYALRLEEATGPSPKPEGRLSPSCSNEAKEDKRKAKAADSSDDPSTTLTTLNATLNPAPSSAAKRKAGLEVSPAKEAPLRTKFALIVKPDCMSQGKGIFLTNNLKDLRGLPKDEPHVVQEYMREPYLIDELKFDIRLYVLVLSCDPLRVFLFQDGIVRFATKKY